MLVWRGGTKIEQFVPGNIDQLLGMETHWEYTMRVYRQLGVSIRFVSGESPNKSSAGDQETDVKIQLNRLIYKRATFDRYLQYLTDRHIGKAKNPPTVRLKDIELQIAQRIKDRLAPLMNFGLPSPRTAMTLGGLDYDAEMKQHEADYDNRQKYIYPYTGFAQAGPTGTAQHTEPGRPTGKVEQQPRQETKGNLMEAQLIDDYETAVHDSWNTMESQLSDPAKTKDEKIRLIHVFILALLADSPPLRPQAYRAGYVYSGGTGTPDPAAGG